MIDIVIINLPDNEDKALELILNHENCTKVKIIGTLKNWNENLNVWIDRNRITYLDLYDLSEMVEWGDPFEYDGYPSGGIYNCNSLEEIYLPKNLMGLGLNYFASCSNLTTIHIPAALKYISSDHVLRAFSETSLKRICLELSHENSWIISSYSHLSVEYSINNSDFEEINGVLYDTNKRQLLRFPKRYKGNFLFPSDIISIAGLSFRFSQIDQLIIPPNVTHIGMGAFSEAIIDTIIFEEGIEKILGGDGSQPDENNIFSTGLVFSESIIKNIILPSTLKEMGTQLFTGGAFEKVCFRHENPVFEIENDIIYNRQLKSVVGFIPNQSPEYVVRNGTETIGKQAFSCEYVKKSEKTIIIILPDSLIRIEEKAFYECNIESIRLPENLKYIGSLAFAVSELRRIVIPNRVECIRKEAFAGCRSLIEIKLPDYLEKIENSAFHSCVSLETINIPQSVRDIDYSCFESCSALKSIILPKGLKTLNHNIFWGCISIETISLPDNLERIGSCAFWFCTSLKNIQLPEGLKYLDDWAFRECNALESINVPSYCEISSPGDEFYQFEGCNSLINITVADDNPYHTFSEGILYNKQGDYLIKNFSDKKIVKILERVQTIGPKSFADTRCEEVLMSDNVVKIGLMAFSNCTNLKHVRFSRNINEIDITQFWVWREGPFGGIFDKCNNLSKLSNVSIETIQKFPEVFKNISGATVSVEVEKKIESKTDNSNSDGPVIGQYVLDAINSNYFVDPQDVTRLVKLIIVHKDEELVKRESIYLNNARHLLEHVRTSLQNIGIIPLRCLAHKTGLRILENPNWPIHIVPREVSNGIMKISEICNFGSHTKDNRAKQFNDFGYRNNHIIEFCIALIKYVKYIYDFKIDNNFDRRYFENKFHDCIYGFYLPDETSETTVGLVKSFRDINPKTGEEKLNIALKHDFDTWGKVTIYKNILIEYYRKTGIEIEENQKIKVKFEERRNEKNNAYWIAKEVLGIVKSPNLIDKQILI